MATVAELVKSYVQLRDKRRELDEQHKQKLAKINGLMGQIEARLQQHFNETGAESVRTDEGTAFRTTRTSVRVADPEAFRAFVEANQAWAMLDARANKSAVEAYLDAQGELPPGLDVNRMYAVNIRRS